MIGIFTVLDLIFLVILAIAALVGLVKGFFKLIFSLISFVVTILLASLLCEALADALYPVFGTSIEASFADWIVSKDTNGMFTTVVDWSNVQDIAGVLSTLGSPALVGNIFGSAMVETVAGFGECALVDKFAPVLAKWTMNVISFVAIVIVVGIILLIIKIIVFKIIEGNTVISGINRLLGMLASLFYTYAVISVIIMLVSSLITSVGLFTFVQDFLAEQSALSQSGGFPLFYFMYNYNFLGEFIVNTVLTML